MSSNDGFDSPTDDLPKQPPREELIVLATKFLQNPKVKRTPLAQRESFLKSKGLTDEEIKLALDHSSIVTPEVHTAVAIPPQPVLQPQTFWSKFRDIANNIALIGGILYSVYYLFQNYIYPFFFGKKKKKTLEKSIADLENSFKSAIQAVQDDIKKVNGEITLLSVQIQHTENASRHIQDLRTDFSSVKSMLLSRNQFPAPEPSPMSQSSIPTWQLTTGNDAGSSVQANADSCCDENCGSGSSDPEIVNNNGSDSSLEMIKE